MPKLLVIAAVLAWAGPWRHTGRWWAGESAVDRYQVVTSAGMGAAAAIQATRFLEAESE